MLQDSLDDGPKNRIFGLLWDSNCYEKALQRLNTLYGIKNSIVEAYISEARFWTPNEKNFDISKFSILVTKMVQVFTALGFEADLKGQAILCDLTKKLTAPLRKSWGKYVQRHSGEQNVTLFEQWLSSEEEALWLGGAYGNTTPTTGSGGHRRVILPLVLST